MDPNRFRGEAAKQPDDTTCGAAALVMARMTIDPGFADVVTDAGAEGFAAACLATHRRTSGWRDRDGKWQLPWPRRLGTSPWGLARELAATTGTPRDLTWVRTRSRDDAFDRVSETLASGHAVPLYVGNAAMPRHVVLALRVHDDTMTFYDPWTGHDARTTRERWTAGTARFGTWTKVWAIVTPAPAAPR